MWRIIIPAVSISIATAIFLYYHFSEQYNAAQPHPVETRRRANTCSLVGCVICKENVRNVDRSLVLPCQGKVHISCWTSIRETFRYCPLCRYPVRYL